MNRKKFCGRNSSNSKREEREKKLRDREKEEDRFTVLPDKIILRLRILVFFFFNTCAFEVVHINVEWKIFLIHLKIVSI